MRAAIRVPSECGFGTGRGPRPPSYHDQSHSRVGWCCERVCLWRQLRKRCLCFPSHLKSSAPPPGVVGSAPDINASAFVCPCAWSPFFVPLLSSSKSECCCETSGFCGTSISEACWVMLLWEYLELNEKKVTIMKNLISDVPFRL